MNKHVKRLVGWLFVVMLWTFSLTANAQSDLLLVEAAKGQDWQWLHTLLDEGGVDVNAAQADGATALAWAVHWGDRETVEHLLEAGADPDIANDYGVTPLFLAIKNHSAAMVETLLEVEGGADPNTVRWTGETALMTAAKTGQRSMVSLLLAQGADVNAHEPRRGQSALMWAISFGHPDVARLLIENGADVHAKTKMRDEDFAPMELDGYTVNVGVTPRGGYTPLSFAARVDDKETARLLLERGADVNSNYTDHGPPLIIAAAAGHEDLALYLLEQGADPNLTVINGVTALHYAMRDGLKLLHNLKVVKRTAKQDRGSALPGSNLYELAEALLARGADPNATMKYPPPSLHIVPALIPRFNMDGATPLFLATAAQDVKAMKILLNAGADPSLGTELNKEKYSEGTRIHSIENQILGDSTMLMAAVGMGRRNKQIFSPKQEDAAIEAAKILINRGADVNTATVSGWTPLHAAAYIGSDSLVTFLVDEGAKINIKNGCGQSPLSLAQRASTVGLVQMEWPADIRESTAELLLALGADDATASVPVGVCVLGRPGLDSEIALEKKLASQEK
jgi:ankyrin repeat protein